MEFKDYYSVLGVAKTASDDEIKRAYRKLARKHHPDLNAGDKAAEAKFKDLNEANEVLGDPEKRRKYDELGANWRAYDQAPGRGPGPSAAWGHGGGQAGYRTMTPEEVQELFGGDSFSDFFHTFFGAEPGAPRGRSRQGAKRRGQDVEAAAELTLEEAFQGTTRRVSIPRGGKDRSIDVRIPAGVPDGARVRAAGEGASGASGGDHGDLFLIVRLLPHPRFERKGQDLYTRIRMPIVTAVLGGEVDVPTLAGSQLRLRIPENTNSGRVFRLRGHGMPAVGRPDDRGDLYATVEIEVPAALTAEERTHYEALKELASGALSDRMGKK